MALCLLVAWYAPPWLVTAAVLFLSVQLGWYWRRERPWQLRWVPGAGMAGRWQMRDDSSAKWRDTALRIDYLGPWLVALSLDGGRRWLWPDSAPASRQRQLRRLLLAQRGLSGEVSGELPR